MKATDECCDFKRADTVRAIQGGPVMHVVEVYDPAFPYRVRCSWTDEHGVPQQDLFRPEQLELVQ
jgi:uncharacterized protein YodC (DUF2158 family)